MKVKLKTLFLLSIMGISTFAFSLNDDDVRSRLGMTIKGTLFDLTFISFPSINLATDIYFDAERTKSFEIGVGYILHSVEEDVKAQGFLTSFRYQHLLSESYKTDRFYLGFGAHYADAKINDFLLVKNTYQGKTYYQYKALDHHKIRYGGAVELIYQGDASPKIFFELSAGMGGTYFETVVPKQVIQKDFKNGIVYAQKQTFLVPIFRLKMGYKLLR